MGAFDFLTNTERLERAHEEIGDYYKALVDKNNRTAFLSQIQGNTSRLLMR